MTEDARFQGLDDPRALPDALRARIEGALLAERDKSDTASDADVRAVRAGGRVRGFGASVRGILAGIDGPREVPRPVRAALAERLARRDGADLRPVLVRALAVAASLVLLAASMVALTWTGRPGDTGIVGGAPVFGPGLSADQSAREPARGDSGSSATGGVADSAPSSQPLPAAPGALEPGGAGPPPPFSYADTQPTLDHAPVPSTLGSGGDGRTAPTFAAPLVVAAVHGGGAQDEGFAAYVSLLNRAGGVRGHRLEIVPAESSRAGDAIATVNLTSSPVPAQPLRTPILESVVAHEDVLHGSTFGFASPPERQGHLIASSVFPDAAPGRTAVIYYADQPGWQDRIADAIATVLRARDVTVLRMRFDPDGQVLLPADAAFLSMPTDAARVWLETARASGYAPMLGVAGIYSLADPALLADLPEGTRLISPYTFASGAEREAMRRETGHALSAELIHGWVTAKSMAVAVWLSGATDGASLTRAIERDLFGYRNGFAPPYEVRPQTRARTPEGLLYRVESGAFVARTGFLRDPF